MRDNRHLQRMGHRTSFSLRVPNGDHPPSRLRHQRANHQRERVENAPRSVERAETLGRVPSQKRIRRDNRHFRRVLDSRDRLLSVHVVLCRLQAFRHEPDVGGRPLRERRVQRFLAVRNFPSIAKLQKGGKLSRENKTHAENRKNFS